MPHDDDPNYFVLFWGSKKVYKQGEGMVDSEGWVRSDLMSHDRAYKLMLANLDNGVSSYTYRK